MTKSGLTHHTALCHDCDAQVNARNAMAWAHNHARQHGHNVELQLAYRISCDAPENKKRRENDSA